MARKANTALGQFLNYRFALQEKQPNRVLFLAVPLDIYKSFFTLTLAQGVVTQYDVKLLIYHPETQEVRQWIS